MTRSVKLPDFYLSMPHDCSYLPERQSVMLFADPHARLSQVAYELLIMQGFRRSGKLVYRPHCEGCNECRPVRIPVARFTPRRGQRRVWQRNQDLSVRRVEREFQQEHFELYCRYQRQRHPGGGMDTDDAGAYREFLVESAADTELYEFRDTDGQLLAVVVLDWLQNGLSAVYTYYDPDQPHRGLGVYTLLWQIEHARDLDLDYLYLGYWIRDCSKMAYKRDYRPLEVYDPDSGADGWSLLDDAEAAE